MSELYDEDAVEDFLAHHGVKGMRWGVSRKPNGSLNFGANPKRAMAKRKEARQNRGAKIEANREKRVNSLLTAAGGNKKKAQLANAGAGVAASLLLGIAGRTAIRALSSSNPNVAEGVKVVTSLGQLGILAGTGINSIGIQQSRQS